MTDMSDDKKGQRKLLARVENPVQTHELWLEYRAGDHAGSPYPFIVCVETGGVYRGERAIDLGSLVHLMLNSTQAELWEIGARRQDWTGQATVGIAGAGCPHGPVSERYCNTCTGVVGALVQETPACTCTGTSPCSPDCRRAVPERRQEAGPEEATHAEPRRWHGLPPGLAGQRIADALEALPAEPEDTRAMRRAAATRRIQALADCQVRSDDPKAVEAYHAHLASSNLLECGACGAKLELVQP